jgi:ribonuclease P protein component
VGSSLARSHILRGYKSFAKVISEGEAIFVKPIRCFYSLNHEAPPSALIGFSVSKSVRRSTQRNYIKRRLREAYRLNKKSFLERLYQLGSGVSAVFVFAAKTDEARKNVNWFEINKAMAELLSMIVLNIQRKA